MHLDRDFTQTEIAGDLLVQQASGHQRHHLPLTRREGGEAGEQGLAMRSGLASDLVGIDSGLDGFPKFPGDQRRGQP
jgi:hypothetical protein